MKGNSRLEYALDLLSPKLKSAIERCGQGEREQISELRLRNGGYFSAVLYSKEYFVTYDGDFMNSPEKAVTADKQDIDFTFNHAFKGSVHSFPRELSQGYITCAGGNRVGFCGTAVCDQRTFETVSVKNISSINIRIAREIIGCAVPIYEKAFSQGLASLIVASPPGGGKTTVLRDLSRLLSEKYRVSLIDERGELACMSEGTAQNNVGLRTDVFNSYRKADAIETAVKVMSPEIIICDEIGGRDDTQALEYAVNSGVRLVCSAHASCYDELKKRPVIGKLIKEKIFDYAAILGTGSMCGRLAAFYKLKND